MEPMATYVLAVSTTAIHVHADLFMLETNKLNETNGNHQTCYVKRYGRARIRTRVTIDRKGEAGIRNALSLSLSAHGVLWAELSARRCDCVWVVKRGEEEELGSVVIRAHGMKRRHCGTRVNFNCLIFI